MLVRAQAIEQDYLHFGPQLLSEAHRSAATSAALPTPQVSEGSLERAWADLTAIYAISQAVVGRFSLADDHLRRAVAVDATVLDRPIPDPDADTLQAVMGQRSSAPDPDVTKRVIRDIYAQLVWDARRLGTRRVRVLEDRARGCDFEGLATRQLVALRGTLGPFSGRETQEITDRRPASRDGNTAAAGAGTSRTDLALEAADRVAASFEATRSVGRRAPEESRLSASVLDIAFQLAAARELRHAASASEGRRAIHVDLTAGAWTLAGGRRVVDRPDNTFTLALASPPYEEPYYFPRGYEPATLLSYTAGPGGEGCVLRVASGSTAKLARAWFAPGLRPPAPGERVAPPGQAWSRATGWSVGLGAFFAALSVVGFGAAVAEDRSDSQSSPASVGAREASQRRESALQAFGAASAGAALLSGVAAGVFWWLATDERQDAAEALDRAIDADPALATSLTRTGRER